MEKIGLLAGAGRLPVECAKAARLLGYEVYAVALLPETDAELKTCTADCREISIAHLDAVLNYLKEKQVRKVTMIGKVTKELLFSGKVQPDARMLKLIMELPDRKDDTIMMMFVRELAKAGMEAFDQTALIRRLMPRRGVITKREPTAEERKDMEFGFRMAKEIGRLDVGQRLSSRIWRSWPWRPSRGRMPAFAVAVSWRAAVQWWPRSPSRSRMIALMCRR